MTTRIGIWTSGDDTVRPRRIWEGDAVSIPQIGESIMIIDGVHEEVADVVHILDDQVVHVQIRNADQAGYYGEILP